MFKKLLLILLINFYFQNLLADEKQKIIEKIIEIKNFEFNFEQITNDRKEIGNCYLVFNNKLNCSYYDDKEKNIIINDKTLVIIQKRYNKIYFYPIKNSPFIKILNKKNLINFIKKAKIEINQKNISLIYKDENKKIINILFEKKSYNLLGWEIEDNFQNKIYFYLKILSINSDYDPALFQIPSP